MSIVEFQQEARYQGCLHIALKSVGEVNKSLFDAVMSVLQSLPPIQLSEPKGTVLFLRFMDGDDLPGWAVSDKKWDQFSAHKCILGLLCISQCYDADELANIKAGFKNVCKVHKSGLCSSKCIVYGCKKNLESCIDPMNELVYIDQVIDEVNVTKKDIHGHKVEEIVNGLAYSIFLNLKSKKIAPYLKLFDEGKLDSLPYLRAPVETKETIDDESEQRFSRNQLARLNKHLADLYLLTGQLKDAGDSYRNASEHLKSQKDWLWVGGAYEGLSVTAMMTKECELVLGKKAQGVEASNTLAFRLRKVHTIKRSGPGLVTSGGGGGGSVGLNPHHRSATIDSRKNKGGSESNISRTARYSSLRRPPAGANSSPPDEDEEGVLREMVIANKHDTLDDDDEEEAVGELDREEEETLSIMIDSRLLHKDFIGNTFRLALVYYRKAGRTGSISLMESLLKFSKYLVDQKHLVKAADMLQRILKIDSISEDDKLSLYRTIASIYHSMGFHRKAAMYYLYAARSASNTVSNRASSTVSNMAKQQLIYDAHTLLIKSLEGYKLSPVLDTLPATAASHIGWPYLQASVLKDFIYLSRQLGENLIVINHACFLLEVLHQHMETSDLKEVTLILESVVREALDKCETTPTFVSSLTGKLTSPIPLTYFPSVRSFYPRPLIKIMAPHRRAGVKSRPTPLPTHLGMTDRGNGANPFIYSPFASGSKKNSKRKEVLWVVKDPAEMALVIANPLPFELRVENMALLMDGVKVEIFPSSLTLPGGSEQSHFALVNIPHESGVVTVKGYEATVFGIRHSCMVKIPDDPIIRVIPKLPLLRVRTSPVLMESCAESLEDTNVGGRRVSRAGEDTFDILDGESCQFQFELESTNDVDITSITISLVNSNDEYCQFSWNSDSLNSSLPFGHASLRVTINGFIPNWYRLISDLSSNFTKPALFSDDVATSSSLKSELLLAPDVVPSSVIMSSPRLKRMWGHRRKASNEGLERRKMREEDMKETSLMDSLNLDHPQINRNNTLPNARHSPPANANQKYNSLSRSSKRGRGSGIISRKAGNMEEEFDFDNDVIFGLDKRASIRSDPGDRDHGGKTKLKSHVGGSSHTSPTSSMATVSQETTHPISIPNSSHSSEPDFCGSPIHKFGSELSSGGKSLSMKHANVPNKVTSSVKGRATISKGNISLPTGPLYKEIPQPYKKAKVVGGFKFEYLGGKSEAEGYYREVETNVSVFVRVCLLFEQFDISNTDKSQELFQLSFILHNVTNLELYVTCKVDQAGLAECGGTDILTENMEPNTSKKLNLLIRKFILESEVPNSPGTKMEIHLSKLYSKKLAQMMCFNWEVVGGGKQRRGSIVLERLSLPMASTPLFIPHLVLFNVTINQEICPPVETTHSKHIKVGSLVRAFIKLTNNSPTILPVSYLVLEPYTFSQELRTILRKLSGKMVHTGSLVTTVPMLPPGSSFEHEVCMTFLHKDNYLLDIKSVIPKDTTTPHSEVSKPTIAKSPVRKAQNYDRITHSSPSSPMSVSPSKPLTTPPPPPVLPKTARAIARRFEMDFANKKIEATNNLSNRPITSHNPPSLTSDVHNEPPPPVPTSTRPHFRKAHSIDLETSRGSSESLKRSCTTNPPATLTKPVPLSSDPKTTSSPTRSLPIKVQSSVVLSKYENLFRERTQSLSLSTASSVHVTSGPNFSFYVS